MDGGSQLADSLTKAMESHFRRATVKHGFYKLCDESAALKERAKTKADSSGSKARPRTRLTESRQDRLKIDAAQHRETS